MFVRADLKFTARQKLAGGYLKAIGAVALYVLIFFIISGFMPSLKLEGSSYEEIQANVIKNYAAFVKAASISAGASFVVQIFIMNPLLVGLAKYFMDNARGVREYKSIFFAFREGYVNVVTTKLVSSIYIFLWSLLLFVPGMVKSYQYYMIDYILAENPGMGTRAVLARSKELTSGIKWKIFVFDLSFIPWIIIGYFGGLIGMALIDPYILASKVELYNAVCFVKYGIDNNSGRIIIEE